LGPGRRLFQSSGDFEKVCASAPNFSKSPELRKIFGGRGKTFLSFGNLEKNLYPGSKFFQVEKTEKNLEVRGGDLFLSPGDFKKSPGSPPTMFLSF